MSETNAITDPVDIVHATWRDIDLNDGRRAHQWYLPDGTLTFDQRTSHGQDEIAATYEKRRTGTSRVARHVAANISREVVDDKTVLPEPPGGYRIRAYPLDAPTAPRSFGRIWRCTSVMVNYLFASDGPRDTTSLSPHSHDDFEQITFALDGDHVHHIRWPWGPDMAHWRPDEHQPVPAPSATVIPARSVHTTQAIGAGHHQLADIFCPPRQDFADKGWVLNADDYPLEG